MVPQETFTCLKKTHPPARRPTSPSIHHPHFISFYSMANLTPTLLIIWSPSSAVANLYCKDITNHQLKKLKAMVGQVIKESEYENWEHTEETIFPKGWTPKETLWFIEEEGKEDDIFVSESDEDESEDHVEEREGGETDDEEDGEEGENESSEEEESPMEEEDGGSDDEVDERSEDGEEEIEEEEEESGEIDESDESEDEGEEESEEDSEEENSEDEAVYV